MKKKLIRFQEILEKNVLLRFLLIGILLAAFFIIWKGSLIYTTSSVCNVEILNGQFWQYAKQIGDHVIRVNHDMYLIDEVSEDLLAGPFASIEYEDFDSEFAYWHDGIAGMKTVPEKLEGVMKNKHIKSLKIIKSEMLKHTGKES